LAGRWLNSLSIVERQPALGNAKHDAIRVSSALRPVRCDRLGVAPIPRRTCREKTKSDPRGAARNDVDVSRMRQERTLVWRWSARLIGRTNVFSEKLKRRHMIAEVGALISSVITLKLASVHGPNEVTIATSVASRPRAIRIRPIRGVLWRASSVCQQPPR
jgi:hypothetical protein